MAASYPALDLWWPETTAVDALDALQEGLHAALDDYAPVAIHDLDAPGGWRVFFGTPLVRDHALATLRRDSIASLRSPIRIEPVDVADDEWARRSQSGLRAITAGRVTVAPPWDVPAPRRDRVVIVIDPSTGFGTGHHETTRLCLELLQALDLSGVRVIDVGTGSGVLAIAACLLGAASVVAVDNDPDALRNARENIGANGVGDLVRVVMTDLREIDAGPAGITPADVVVANLTAAVLEREARHLRALTAPGGTLLVSGFGPGELSGVVAALGAASSSAAHDGDWTAARLTIRA